jgi:hypothetical protein
MAHPPADCRGNSYAKGGKTDRRAASDRLREVAKTEVQTIGVAELARLLGVDVSNLRKAVTGTREFGLELKQALQRYGGGQPPNKGK